MKKCQKIENNDLPTTMDQQFAFKQVNGHNIFTLICPTTFALEFLVIKVLSQMVSSQFLSLTKIIPNYPKRPFI